MINRKDYMIEVYTDGACNIHSEIRPGGWAYNVYGVTGLLGGNSGNKINTTNNEMELMAILKAMQKIVDLGITEATFYSDSAYACNTINQKWYVNWRNKGWKRDKNQPVANLELWKQIIDLYENHDFYIKKVLAHASDERNNLVDKMAVQEKEKANG